MIKVTKEMVWEAQNTYLKHRDEYLKKDVARDMLTANPRPVQPVRQAGR